MASLQVTLINETGMDPDRFEQLCERLFDRIVDRTPVDTGACRDAWEMYFEDEDTCIFSNGVEYVSFLEDGWSKQAPRGMIQITLDEIPEIKSDIS